MRKKTKKVAKKMPKRERLLKVLGPVEEEVYNLLDMFEFFLVERQLRKPIEVLADSVRDLRIIIQQILMEHFQFIPFKDAEPFMKALAQALAKRSAHIPTDGSGDRKYVDYCIGEIITAFEWAAEIKREFPDDEISQKILSLDIPVLRPFDYGLRSKIRLVRAPKKKRR